MSKKEIKRLVILNIPYLILGLLATNLGEAWRLAEGIDISAKLLAFFSTVGQAFANPMPSFYPSDLLVGLFAGGCVRLAVYLKGKMLRSIATIWNTGRRDGEQPKTLNHSWLRNLKIILS